MDELVSVGRRRRRTDPQIQLQTNDLTFSIGGVGEGVATEGRLILSDLLVPPLSSQCLRWGAPKVDTRATSSRSVPPGRTKGATCMLIHQRAFREGSGAEAEGRSVLLRSRGPGGP